MSVQSQPPPAPSPAVTPPAAEPRPTPAERARAAFEHLADGALPAEGHLRLLWLLLGASLLLRVFWLARPDGALIFDEKYYVNSARVIAGIPPRDDVYQDNPLGLDPNTEHPPLAKLLVAGSIRLLGDNPFGWRLPSVLAGMAAILLMYGVGRRLDPDPAVAVLAATLLAFDNLVFVHSRIFTLDIFQVAFMLLGLYWYLGGRPVLGGVGLGLAALCKIGGAFGLGALAAYEGLRLVRGDRPWREAWRPAARRLAILVVAFLLTFLPLLGIMDRIWVGYAQPLEHVERILTYGAALRRPSGPSGIESVPWQWLWNDTEIPYLKVEQQVRENDQIRETRPVVLFLGAMNPFVLQLWPFGLAFVGYAWGRRRPSAGLGALALAWFACTYAPFYGATLLGQRISYLFYFLPTLPAVALAGSAFLLKSGLPRPVIWAYLAAVLLGFYGYFPFKLVP